MKKTGYCNPARIFQVFCLFALITLANIAKAGTHDLSGSWKIDQDGMDVEMTLWPLRSEGKAFPNRYQAFIFVEERNCLGIAQLYQNTETKWVHFKARSRDDLREGNCLYEGRQMLMLMDARGDQGGFKMAADGNSFRHEQVKFYVGGQGSRPYGWSRFTPLSFSRQSLSPEMKNVIETVFVNYITLPIQGDFEGLNIPSREERPSATIFARYSAGKYLEALFNGDDVTLRNHDSRFSAIYLQGAGSKQTRAHRDFTRLWNGQKVSTDEEDEATVAWLKNMSLVSPIMITYLFNYESIYKACLGPSPRTVTFTTEWIETTFSYDGFPTTTEHLGTTKTSYTVKKEHYDMLRDIALKDPLIAADIDDFFHRLAADKDRLRLSSVVRGTQEYMRDTPCTSAAAQKMEKQLVAAYQKYLAAQQVFVDRSG